MFSYLEHFDNLFIQTDNVYFFFPIQSRSLSSLDMAKEEDERAKNIVELAFQNLQMPCIDCIMYRDALIALHIAAH